MEGFVKVTTVEPWKLVFNITKKDVASDFLLVLISCGC